MSSYDWPGTDINITHLILPRAAFEVEKSYSLIHRKGRGLVLDDELRRPSWQVYTELADLARDKANEQ